MNVLIELSSSDPRVGAVNDALDLAHYTRDQHVTFWLCGPVDAELERLAAREGMRVLRRQSRAISRRESLAYLWDVLGWVRVLRRIRPDVVHLNFSGYGPSLGLAASLCGIPVVGRAGAVPMKFSRAWFSAFAANGRAHASQLLASALAPRVRIMGDLFRPSRLAEQGGGAPLPPRVPERTRFLFLGQLVERKGLAMLVEALAAMTADADLVLAGGDWNDPGFPQRLRARIAELGLDERVFRYNHREDVARLLSSCDALVLPSLSEARPRVIVEAMCMGVPVIASAVGGIPELVEHGVNGLLVEPGDVASLARAMDELAGSWARRAVLGHRARQRALVDLHPERTAERYVQLYRELARQSPGRAA